MELFTGTIEHVMCDGLTATVKLDSLFLGRRYAVIDDRTAGRKRLCSKMGGRLVPNRPFVIKEMRKIANDIVITVID